MSSHPEKDEKDYVINFKELLGNRDIPAVIKMAAMQLQKNSYQHPGEWIQSISDSDLALLEKLCSDCSRVGTAEAEKSSVSVGMLSLVLSTGEGMTINQEMLRSSFVNVITFIAAESLKRRGLVEINYENMSFAPETADLPLVRYSAKP
jgi:hypothetical protein